MRREVAEARSPQHLGLPVAAAWPAHAPAHSPRRHRSRRHPHSHHRRRWPARRCAPGRGVSAQGTRAVLVAATLPQGHTHAAAAARRRAARRQQAAHTASRSCSGSSNTCSRLLQEVRADGHNQHTVAQASGSTRRTLQRLPRRWQGRIIFAHRSRHTIAFGGGRVLDRRALQLRLFASMNLLASSDERRTKPVTCGASNFFEV